MQQRNNNNKHNNHNNHQRKRRVAIIGAGISGVGAASALHDSGVVDVVLYEKESWIGGHANTRRVTVPSTTTTTTPTTTKREVEVDCGFMVMNRITYPNLIEFFNSKGVETEPSDMSFAVSVGDNKAGFFEWGSDSLSTVFAQRSNILNPWMYGFIMDILRFESQVNQFLYEYDALCAQQLQQPQRATPLHTSTPPLMALAGATPLVKQKVPLVVPSPTASAQDRDIVDIEAAAAVPVELSLREQKEAKTLGQFLEENNYGKYFVDYYALPMCQAIWSCPQKDVLGFPAIFLFRFMKNHHLLSVTARPQWQTVAGRTQKGYVQKVTKGFKHNIRLNTQVKRVVTTEEGKVQVEDEYGKIETFDDAIFATHAPDTLNILGEHATIEEREILGAFEYQDNDIWLHHDEKLMPKNKSVWSSWNFLGNSKGGVCVTYWLNRLQNLGDSGGVPILLTLNPSKPPREELVACHWTMAHPVPSVESSKAEKHFKEIQGVRNLYFCGAYTGYGFHEDGYKSGLAAANWLLGNSDWQPLALKPFFTPSWKESIEKKIVVSYLTEFIKKGRLLLCEDGGEVIVFGQSEFEFSDPDLPEPAMLNIHNPCFYSQLAERADLGLAEAFMDGHVSSPNLLGFFEIIICNRDAMREQNNNSIKMISTSFLNNSLAYLRHMSRANSTKNTRKNIHAHYDLGNKMFSLFLDETMTYSCGIFKSPNDSLYQSQINKLNAMIEKARITPECSVLEIGFGWGSLSIAIAERYGCHVTGITLSEEQKAYAEALVKKKGLSHLIDYHLVDYRLFNAPKKFDRIVSCEMLEAVGHEFLPEFFTHCGRLLTKNGVLVVQVITMPDDRYDEYRKSSDFIKEYIFPGGCTPSLSAIVNAYRQQKTTPTNSQFVIDQIDNIGPHYATTLRLWKENFLAKKAQLLELGLDETFIRKWEYYFVYCEAGFKTCTLSVLQIVFTRPGNSKVFGCKL